MRKRDAAEISCVPEQQPLIDPAGADEGGVEDLGVVGRHHLRHGEIRGASGRYGEVRGDARRYGEMRGDRHHDALGRVDDAVEHIEQARQVEPDG